MNIRVAVIGAALAGSVLSAAAQGGDANPSGSPIDDAAVADTNAPRIVPDGWQESYDAFHYAPAVVAGDTIYLSGVVASLQGDENENNDGDLEASFDRAFETLGAILEDAGADWSHVVEMTTFHTELIHQIGPFTASKDKYLKAPYPSWTAIDVDRLYPERGVVEIKLIAYVGD
ncbi:MAG: RidA family protein [Pseudomonadota bacterium]